MFLEHLPQDRAIYRVSRFRYVYTLYLYVLLVLCA